MTVNNISIIIPVKDQEELTRACLASLRGNDNEDTLEIIVIDNCSKQPTADLLSGYGWDKLRVVRTDRPLSFSQSCNEGAAAARGGVLLFMNNDVTVAPGWLDDIGGAFRRHGGVAGAKLRFPGGGIQHGGEVFPLWGIPFIGGTGAAEDDPDFSGTRRRWGVIAALMMIGADTFDRLGGYDERYFFGLEDIDLCFTAIEGGAPVYCVDTNKVFHHAEGSIGAVQPDVTMKRNLSNRRVFLDKWNTARNAAQERYLARLSASGICNVSLFGAGEAGRISLALLSKAGIRVSSFIDSDPAKTGSVIDGVPVAGLDEGLAGAEAIIVTSQRDRSAIDAIGAHGREDILVGAELPGEEWSPGDILD